MSVPFLGLNVTFGLIIFALIFYIVGARYPGLAQRFGLASS